MYLFISIKRRQNCLKCITLLFRYGLDSLCCLLSAIWGSTECPEYRASQAGDIWWLSRLPAQWSVQRPQTAWHLKVSIPFFKVYKKFYLPQFNVCSDKLVFKIVITRQYHSSSAGTLCIPCSFWKMDEERRKKDWKKRTINFNWVIQGQDDESYERFI